MSRRVSIREKASDGTQRLRRRMEGHSKGRCVSAEAGDVLFDAATPFGFVVRVTRRRWELITTAKHPVMAGREASVRVALEAPDEVRQSRTDPQVLLFYKAEATNRWTCAVAKRLEDRGFLITAYRTDAIKEGVRIWPN